MKSLPTIETWCNDIKAIQIFSYTLPEHLNDILLYLKVAKLPIEISNIYCF